MVRFSSFDHQTVHFKLSALFILFIFFLVLNFGTGCVLTVSRHFFNKKKKGWDMQAAMSVQYIRDGQRGVSKT